MSGMHRLQPDELESLSQLRQERAKGYFVFSNERGERMTTGAIAKIMHRAGVGRFAPSFSNGVNSAGQSPTLLSLTSL